MINIGLVDLDTTHPAFFASLLKGGDDLRVTAVFDGGAVQTPEYVAHFAREHGVARVCASLDELVSSVDGAIVCSQNWDLRLERVRPFLEAGKPVFIDKPMVGSLRDMDALIAKVVSGLDHQLKHVGAQLHRSALPPCKGDAIQLSRVFANLFGNALKFLDPQRPGVIAIRGAMETGRCVYCVEDNGIGIAPEHQGRIFELFHRLDPSRTEGEGLGLAIVQQILGRLDGEIWVESTPGTGSRFFVSLPPVRSKESFPGPV